MKRILVMIGICTVIYAVEILIAAVIGTVYMRISGKGRRTAAEKGIKFANWLLVALTAALIYVIWW